MTALLTIEAEDAAALMRDIGTLAGAAFFGAMPAPANANATLDGFSDQELLDELTARMTPRAMTVVVRAARGTKKKDGADNLPSAAATDDERDPAPGELADQADQAEDVSTDTTDTADTAAPSEADQAQAYDQAIRLLADLHKQGGRAKGLVLAARGTLGVQKFSELPKDRGPALLATARRIAKESADA